MGLFGFGKKKITDVLNSPVVGKVQTLENVADPVFAQKVMGEGFGVVPNNEKIYSPVTATVTSVFKTKHAIGLKTDDGLEVMVHMGLDTVELNGEPFEIKVNEGDKVEANTLIATMNLNKVKDAGKDTVVLTIVTNTADKLERAEMTVNDTSSVDNGDAIMSVTLK
jgi:glucose-specific phosphotransferase system IIA component